jgi:ABC-2 type transport system ATP-binding protein
VLEVSFSAATPDWIARLNALPFVEGVTNHDDVFRIASGNGPGTTTALLSEAAAAGIEVRSLAVQSTTLDDVFVHYTGRQLRDALQEPPPGERFAALYQPQR